MDIRPNRLKAPVDYENGPNPSGICMCGCGKATPIAKQTISEQGAVRGKPKRFVPGHNPRCVRGPGAAEYLVDPESGCWVYQGYVNPDWGYGVKYCPVKKKQTTAHRFYYEQIHGPQDGMVIDHLCHKRDGSCAGGASCRHRRCVNPDHLKAKLNKANILRGCSPPAINSDKTHCVHGHEFTPGNTYYRKDRTGRQCRECKRRRDKEYSSRSASLAPSGRDIATAA